MKTLEVGLDAVEAAFHILNGGGDRKEAVDYLMKFKHLDHERADAAVTAAQTIEEHDE